MYVIDMVLMTVFATVVGVLGAAAITWLSWTAFRLVNHPDWGPPTGLVVLVMVAIRGCAPATLRR